MSRILRHLPLAIAVLVVFCAHAGLAQACPSCKDGLEQGQANLIQSYFWSILFMMSMPFVIFGSLSTYFYLEVRRARARQAAQGFEPVLPVGLGEPLTA